MSSSDGSNGSHNGNGGGSFIRLWQDLHKTQETAAYAAIAGRPITELLDPLQATYDEAIAYVDRRDALKQDALSEEEVFLRSELAQLEVDRAKFRNMWAPACDESIQAEIEEKKKGAVVMAAERSISAKALEASRDENYATLEQDRRYAKVLADLDTEYRQANASSISALKTSLNTRLEHNRRQFNDVSQSSHDIQERGFTRQVANFLVWAFGFSLAGVGVLVAQVLTSHIHESSTTSSLLATARTLLGADDRNATLWILLARYYGVVIGFLVIYAGLIGLTLWFFKRRERSKSASDDTPHAENIGRPMDFGGLVTLVAPSIGSRIGTIGRSTLEQMFAILPIVFAISIVGFLFVFVKPDGSNNAPSLKTIYVGTVYAVIEASNGLLFWLAVLLPWMRGKPTSRPVTVFYFLLILLPIAALVISAMPQAQGGLVYTAMLAVSALMSLVGLGHGMYLRGIFAREEFLDREGQRIRTLIAATGEQPTTFSKLVLLNHSREHSPRRFKRRRPTRWFEQLRAGNWTFWRERSEPLFESSAVEDVKAKVDDILASTRVPRELLEKYGEADQQHTQARAKLNAAQRQQQALSDDRSGCESRLREARTRLGQLHAEKIKAHDEHLAARLRLRFEFDEIRGATVEAYKLIAYTNGKH